MHLPTFLGILLIALFLSSTPTSAGSAFRYTDAHGTPSYTDSLDRVPAAHKAQVAEVELTSLAGYPRYTPAIFGFGKDPKAVPKIEDCVYVGVLDTTPEGEAIVAWACAEDVIVLRKQPLEVPTSTPEE